MLDGDLYIRHFHVFDMPQKEASGGEASEHAGLGVFALFFHRIQFCHCGRPTAKLVQVNIADFDVFDAMTGDAAHNRAKLGQRTRADHVVDEHPLQASHRNVLRAAHSGPQAQEQR